jgi:hypothetical protein
MKLALSILPFVLVGMLLGLHGGGFQIFFALPVLLITYAVRAIKARGQPTAMRRLHLRLAAWLVLFTLVMANHWFTDRQLQTEADTLRARIEAYQLQHHAYPATLDQLGGTAHVNPMIRYVLVQNRTVPYLTYPTSFTPFGKAYYDFAAHTWRQRTD